MNKSFNRKIHSYKNNSEALIENSCIRYLLVFLMLEIVALFYYPGEYYYDANVYYQLSQSFIDDNGKFGLNNYSVTIRGYLLPFIFLCYTLVGRIFGLQDYVGIITGNSLLIAYLIAIILPGLFKNKEKKYITIKCLMISIIFSIYWRDFIIYPLSDIYSCSFILFIIYVLFNLHEERKDNKKLYIASMVIGGLLYASYNIRTIYIFVAPLILGILLIEIMVKQREKKYHTILLIMILMAVGALIVSLPQSYINLDHYMLFTPKVLTETGYAEGLFNRQLYWGLSIQFYMTYVGPGAGGIRWYDEAGNLLLQTENLMGINTIRDYIELIIKYPLDYLGMMGRHFLNALYLPYAGGVYIQDIWVNKTGYTLVNYSILFFGISGYFVNKKCIKKTKKNSLKIKIQSMMQWCNDEENIKKLYLLGALLPCICILPGAIESRFFITAYCLIYGYVAFGCSFKKMLQNFKEHYCVWIIIYVSGLVVGCAVWGSALASSVVPILLR